MADLTWKCEKCGFENNTGNFCGMCGSAKMHCTEPKMQRLTCEMCGGNNLIKQNGLYVCQHCGTKYTVEEARQLFISGTVKIDNSQEIENLYQLARRAAVELDCENAQKYYEQILLHKPNHWEPVFYSAYFKLRNCKPEELENESGKFKSKLETIFTLVDEESVSNQNAIIADIAKHCVMLITPLKVKMLDFSVADSIKRSSNKNLVSDINIDLYNLYCGKNLVEIINILTEKFKQYEPDENITWSRFYLKERCVDILFDIEKYATGSTRNRMIKQIKEDQEEIVAHDPNYKIRKVPSRKKGACFIATAVYGSYDCPQVWVLRRFRDEVLMPSLFGRLFVKTYYAVSPELLKLVGDTKEFKAICLKLLNVFVGHLKRNGYSDKPYEDR